MTLGTSSDTKCDVAKLDEKALREAIPTLQGWKRHRGRLVQEFTFPDFKEALRFVNAVGRIAEKLAHHPDIDIRWNRVHLALSTHSEGGLTLKDIDLARRIDKVVWPE
jgi:4a-hydroxytetrahydrobiopterin dehydratase